jgi:hypothetical protein
VTPAFAFDVRQTAIEVPCGSEQVNSGEHATCGYMTAVCCPQVPLLASDTDAV